MIEVPNHGVTMNLIRTLQYAILAFALVVTVCWFTFFGSVYLVFSKFLGLSPTAESGQQGSDNPIFLTILAATASLLIGLEVLRGILLRRKLNAE